MSFVLSSLVAESMARTTFPLHGGDSGGHPAEAVFHPSGEDVATLQTTANKG